MTAAWTEGLVDMPGVRVVVVAIRASGRGQLAGVLMLWLM